MPTPIPSRYALDLTGNSPNNLVLGEIHSLSTRKIRSIATTYGPYYTESIKVYDNITQHELTRNVDYNCLDIVGLPTAQSGKEICSILVITNQTVSNSVRLEYQALGGGYERSYEAIKLLMDNLTNDDRPIAWPNILNRPVDYNPTMHLHRLGDVIGFEYVVAILEQLKNSILLGDQVGHTEILDYIDYNANVLTQLINNAQNASTVIALARATDANNNATAALQSALATDLQVNNVENTAIASLAKSSELIRNITNSENDAKYLLSLYPNLFSIQSAANLNFIPSTNNEALLVFPGNETTGLISRDYYAIDYTGKIISGLDDDSDPNQNNDLIFLLDLSTYKEINTRKAQIKLRINLFDQRDINGIGYYGKEGVLRLFPFQIDNGDFTLSSVSAGESSYVYSEAPYDGILTGLSYGVIGIDATPTLDLKVEPTPALDIATRIGNYLLDKRPSYNVVGYGSVTSKKGINIKLSPGSEITFTFNLKGTDVAQVRKDIFLNFSHYFKLMQSTKPASTLIQTVLKDGPDKNKVRSISGFFS